MVRSLSHRILPALTGAALLAAVIAVASAENIDPNNNMSQYAWGENVGWINAEPGGPGGDGLQVSGSKITGWMWGENIGWINMHCENRGTCGAVPYGVTNDNAGNLGGYAWAENVGWISFCDQDTPGACNASPTYRVVINPATGIFSGFAWGENIGWISFSDTSPVAYQVQTDDGDGIAGGSDNCPFDANGSQTNTDNAPITTPGIIPLDITIPMSDARGDGCDPDDDNDGILDVNEAAGCNGSGPLNPLNPDTDADRIRDGAECALGSNPASAASKPPSVPPGDTDADGLPDALEATLGTNPNAVQSDGDGISDGIEYKGYSSNLLSTNGDGDTCTDGREIASVDANTTVNITDIGIVVNSFGANGANRHNIDLTKNGTIDILDILLVAVNFAGTPC